MIPKVGERWKHFKGDVYLVRGFARHSENTHEMLVIYSQIHGPDEWWARPVESWVAWVERSLEDGTQYSGPRFVRFSAAPDESEPQEDGCG